MPDDIQGGIEEKLLREFDRVQQELKTKTEALKQTVEDRTKLIEQEWNRNKLALVPGDLLLDRVCEKFGVRFKKNTDSARLAALMQEWEIDSRMRTLITQIST